LVATQAALLADGFEMAFDTGDVARPTEVLAVKSVDAAWLGTIASSAVGVSHLRLRLRMDPLTLAIQDARELVGAGRQAVEQCPALWDMLSASGHLAP